MARASVTSPPTDELYLIQGEMPETRDVEDARQWVTIYRELATFAERTLNRLRSGEDNRQAVALVSHDADERSAGCSSASTSGSIACGNWPDSISMFAAACSAMPAGT